MNPFSKIELGGKYAISYKIGIAFLPFMVFATGFTNQQERVRFFYWDWTFASFIATSISAITLFTIDKSIWRNRLKRPIKAKYLFITGFFLGVIKGFLTDFLAQSLFHVPNLGWQAHLSRAVSAGGIGLVAIPLIAFLSYSRNALLQRRISITEEIKALYQLDPLNSYFPEDTDLVQHVSDRLDHERDKLTQVLENPNFTTPDEMADYLNLLANNLIRPLSHDLAKQKHRWLRPRRVNAQLFSYLPHAISWGAPWFLSLWFVTQYRQYLLIFGFGKGTTLSIIDIFVGMAMIYVFEKIFSQPKYLSWKWMWIIPAGLLVDTTLVEIIRRIWLPYGAHWFVVITFLWMTFLFFVVSYATTIFAMDQMELEQMQNEYSRKLDEFLRKDLSDSTISSAMARYLHGSVQTRLISSAYRIRNLTPSDQAGLKTEIKLAIDHLKVPKFIKPVVSFGLEESMRNVIAEWDPLVRVHLQVSDERIDSNPDVARRMANVLNEAISNALRHGESSELFCEITAAQEGLDLTLSGVGRPLDRSGEYGIGSQIFDQLTDGWSLLPNPANDGVRFQAFFRMTQN